MDYIILTTKEGWRVAVDAYDIMAVEEDADYRNHEADGGEWFGRGSTVVTKHIRYSVRESFDEVGRQIEKVRG